MNVYLKKDAVFMSTTLKIVAAVVVLGAAIALYVTRSSGTESVTSRTSFNAAVRCMDADCGHTYKMQAESSAEWPCECEKCGKKTAWRLKKCRQCKALFLPPVSGDPPRQPVMATCPECGSQSTGAAKANDIE